MAVSTRKTKMESKSQAYNRNTTTTKVTQVSRGKVKSKTKVSKKPVTVKVQVKHRISKNQYKLKCLKKRKIKAGVVYSLLIIKNVIVVYNNFVIVLSLNQNRDK